jgi:hypothetical protein
MPTTTGLGSLLKSVCARSQQWPIASQFASVPMPSLSQFVRCQCRELSDGVSQIVCRALGNMSRRHRPLDYFVATTECLGRHVIAGPTICQWPSQSGLSFREKWNQLDRRTVAQSESSLSRMLGLRNPILRIGPWQYLASTARHRDWIAIGLVCSSVSQWLDQSARFLFRSQWNQSAV